MVISGRGTSDYRPSHVAHIRPIFKQPSPLDEVDCQDEHRISLRTQSPQLAWMEFDAEGVLHAILSSVGDGRKIYKPQRLDAYYIDLVNRPV